MATPNLNLPELVSGQSGAETTHNLALTELSILVQGLVLDRDLTAPPGSPVVGDTYIPLATATDVWTGHEDDIAWFDGSAWRFKVPNEGWSFRVADENIRIQWDGAAWVDILAGAGGGGAWEFVDTTTTVGLVSSVDIPGLDSSAEAWLIRFKFWFTQAAAPGVRVRSAASFQTADYRFHSSQPRDSSSAYAGLNAATTDRFKIPGTVASFAANRPITGTLEIYDPAATDHRKTMTVDMGHWDANSVILRHVTAHGAWDGGDGAIDQLRFLASIGNFAIGATFHLFKRTAA